MILILIVAGLMVALMTAPRFFMIPMAMMAASAAAPAAAAATTGALATGATLAASLAPTFTREKNGRRLTVDPGRVLAKGKAAYDMLNPQPNPTMSLFNQMVEAEKQRTALMQAQSLAGLQNAASQGAMLGRMGSTMPMMPRI